jgi:uncharacterized membrane protein YbhN (UPF0104 family)
MRMPVDRGKLAFAGLISAILLGWLGWTAGFALPPVAAINSAALAGLAGSIVLILLGRSLSFRAMAPPGQQHGYPRWLQLAARHQAVFALFPGGAGDIGFPYLARKLAGIDAPVAVRIIAQVRLRDMVFLALLGLGGLASAGRGIDYAALAMVVAVVLLWFIDDLTALGLGVLMRVLPGSRLTALLDEAAKEPPQRWRVRLLRTALTAVVWCSTLFAVIAGFAVIGVPITPGQAMLIVAAINVAGAVAISIAGLGVSEAGAAAALVILGFAPERAAAIALLVRPILLAVIVAVSIALDLALALFRARRSQRGDASR